MIGTTEEKILKEEALLNRQLPNTFKNWLLQNNGGDIKGINGCVSVFPVKDENNIKKTWESIYSYYTQQWASDIHDFQEEGVNYSTLLPFGYVEADYYCFDYSEKTDNEPIVVLWSHETGETDVVAKNFDDFFQKVIAGELDS